MSMQLDVILVKNSKRSFTQVEVDSIMNQNYVSLKIDIEKVNH